MYIDITYIPTYPRLILKTTLQAPVACHDIPPWPDGCFAQGDHRTNTK